MIKGLIHFLLVEEQVLMVLLQEILEISLILSLAALLACICAIVLLYYFKDSSPVFDGITTVLSVFGMYLTVKRCIEQWIIWMVVNGLSSLMWLNLVIHGAKTYATFIMWVVYFILAVYFYFCWEKEIGERN